MREPRRITNRWITPLAGGSFLLVAATGITLFFHVNTIIGHVVHEWLGWLLVVAVGLHLFANGGPLLAHLRRSKVRWALGVFTVLTLISVIPFGQSVSPESATRGAMMRITNAPLEQLAPLAGRDVDGIIADLQRAGFTDVTRESTCRTLAGTERPALFRAVSIVFPHEEPR